MRKHSIFLLIQIFFIQIISISEAAIELTTSPIWESSDHYFATGGGLADLDGDGYLELVASNGNDMATNPENAYQNNNGTFSTNPYWISADNDCSGHCSLGDINDDGLVDLVVGNYGCAYSFPPGTTKMYRGQLGGGFETSPSWITPDLNNTFRVSLVDVDADGDLDLATANGESYTSVPQANEIYFNVGGQLQTTPGWYSSEIDCSYDLAWGDVDGDGDLDLAVANSYSPHRLYRNQNGTLETTACWSSTEVDDGNSITWGDVDGDGDLDLAVATVEANVDKRGKRVKDPKKPYSGRFRLYENLGGTLSTSAIWVSTISGAFSAVAFGDVDHDGDLDLAGGEWWGGAFVFENQNGNLTHTPVWNAGSTYSSVVEKALWGDIDGDGLTQYTDFFDGDGTRKLFYLPYMPINTIVEIRVEDQILNNGDYCYDNAAAWISLKSAPPVGQNNIRIIYRYSQDLDLVVTNWDNNKGNYLFDNQRAHDVPSLSYCSLILMIILMGIIIKYFDFRCLC